jgi:hypothetical protein
MAPSTGAQVLKPDVSPDVVLTKASVRAGEASEDLPAVPFDLHLAPESVWL